MAKELSDSSILPPPDLSFSSQNVRTLSPFQAGLSILNTQISFKNEVDEAQVAAESRLEQSLKQGET